MFYFINFSLCWLCWLTFADKKRWRELFAVSLLALFTASLSEDLMHHYLLWEYLGGNGFVIGLLNSFGIYIVIPYLFIQWLPKELNLKNLLWYGLIWSVFALGIEWVYLFTKHMKYYKWWNLGFSFLADGFLFWVFYQFHKIFHLERLSKPS